MPSKSDRRSAARRQMWLLPQEGAAQRQRVAEVAVAARVRRLVAYGVPAELAATAVPGARVRVPFGRGNRLLEGVCVRVDEREWDHTRRPLDAVQPGPALLDEALLALGVWLAEYYFCPPGQALDSMVPAPARRPRVRRERWLAPVAGAAADDLTSKQQAVLAALANGPLPLKQALERAGVGAAVIAALKRRGLVSVETRAVPIVPDAAPTAPGATFGPVPEDDYALTPAQQAAVGAIDAAAGRFRAFLLFGIPGSGKTEVYVRAIRAAVAAGRQAILIVPEIALATQVVGRLARRFERVALLHSQLTDRQRGDTLRAVADGRADVVIGTRTAIFAPCRRLGLIVVDEEQEGSLKNLGRPFFHARDVALKRGQLQHVPVVLGSATPSLETWYNAHHLPHFQLLTLPERVPGAEVPRAELIVASGRELGQTTTVLSAPLAEALKATLRAGHQVILLHNRRGYAQFLRCERCGLIVRCPRCDAHFVLHGGRQAGGAPAQLVCHRCGHRQPAGSECPDSTCGGHLERAGLAIQRLEEELRRLLPQARLLRLDRDTMRRRADYEAALQAFEAGGADVLLGTQMVAKGLDFPGVRLVGVIDADAALWLPDFRAGERVFQLLMQVVGRAGRKAGASQALVQVGGPPAPPIVAALQMDYPGFAAAELQQRQALGYPPFTRLARLVLADARPGQARNAAARLAADLRSVAGRVHPALIVDDANPCVIPRLRELWRHQIIIRGPRDLHVQRLLAAAADEKLLSPRVQRFTVDVDAVDLL